MGGHWWFSHSGVWFKVTDDLKKKLNLKVRLLEERVITDTNIDILSPIEK